MQHTLYIRTYEVKINKCEISSLWWHTSAPYTCKIYYFNMQYNYINMHIINFCQFFFLRVNFLTNAIIWHYIHATCNIIMFTCDLFMSTCDLFMSSCNIIMSTCDLFMSTCNIIMFICDFSHIDIDKSHVHIN